MRFDLPDDKTLTLERTDQPGVLYATGGAKTVWIDYAEQKSVALPDSIRSLFA